MAKILVVDDEPLLRTILRDMLEQGGHEVLSADSGAKGILLARAERPDLILLDVMMPGLDGYQTCTGIKRDPLLQHIPVLLVSATKDVRVVDKAERAGACGVLPKPFPPAELEHAIALALTAPPSV
jgi:twitching motility two-component system response regulator PilH